MAEAVPVTGPDATTNQRPFLFFLFIEWHDAMQPQTDVRFFCFRQMVPRPD